MSPERYSSQDADPTLLGEKLTFNCGRTAQNRFLKAGMSERLGTWDLDVSKRGIPTDRLINAYEKWGHGGFGLIVSGNVPVDPHHLQLPGNVVVCKENDSHELREQMRRWSAVTKKEGSLAILQLTHAGALTPFSVNPTPFGPSDVHIVSKKPHSKYGRATALTVEQIQNDVIDRFVYAAKLAQQTGFDGVEIYAAHGFLLSQFMSPSTNKRNDQYGGTVENRIRLVLEIYDTIRKELRTDFVIGIKANSVEFQEEGLQTEDAKMMCELIEKRGFDFVELSGGTVERSAFFHEKDSTRQREAFFLEFTDKIRPVFRDTKVFVTGGFRTVTGMVKAVELNSTEGIGIARPVASEPDLPKKILSGEVQGAIKHKFDPDDYRVTSVAAVSSLFLMGKRSLCELDGRIMGDIPDFSRTDEVEHFLKQMKVFMRRIIEMAEQNLPVDAILEYEALHVY